jgi:Putative methionine and alanine importer, small subunit
MEAGAVAMMVIGMVIIWGGLAASVVHAVRKSRS